MRGIFSEILNMSMTASLVILFVLAARLGLKKAPKIFSYALWSVVLFRLLCPVSIPSPVSLLELTKPAVTQSEGIASSVSYLPVEYVAADMHSDPQPALRFEAQKPVAKAVDPGVSALTIAAYIWLAGLTVMLLRSAAEYVQLRRRLIGAIPFRGEVYLADHISTPFVLGILRPKIYLPSDMPSRERRYIVAHERHHIRRCDHIFKLLAYVALSIHWFNPLAWVAFVQAGKDMEMSCDEAVIKKLGSHIRADYSASLLRLATHRSRIVGTPLAFGEGDTKGRVLNMAKWKKPKTWVSILCLILCIAILVACAVNPEKQTEDTTAVEIDTTFTGKETVKPTETGHSAPPVEGGNIVTSLDLTAASVDGNTVTYGLLSMTLPDGYSASVSDDGSIILTKDGTKVGGITHWPTPDFELVYPSQTTAPASSNMDEWVQALGIPEAQKSDEPIAHMIEGSLSGYLTAWYGNELEPEKLNVEHNLFIEGVVYDIWFDENKISDIHSGKILKTVYISGQPTVVTQTEDGSESLAKCRAVLETVQSSSCQIAIEQINGSTNTLWSVSNFYQHDGNWLKIIDIDPETEDIADGQEWSARMAYMYANGIRYSNEGRGGNAYSDINWAEYEYFDDSMKPWLSSFQWQGDNVTYVDTLTSNGDTVVMLRIDEPYPGLEEETVCYWVDFYFDASGSFLKAGVEVDYIRNDEVQTIDNTESIVTLDAETVAAEIAKEYNRATTS